MGGNVEDDFAAYGFLHTFALSKDKNKLNDRNVILIIKNGKKYEKDDFRHSTFRQIPKIPD